MVSSLAAIICCIYRCIDKSCTSFSASFTSSCSFCMGNAIGIIGGLVLV
jgi:hypothetical protein